MKPRERMLAMIVGALVGVLGLLYGYDFVMRPFADTDNQIASLNDQIAKKELDLAKARQAQRQLRKWQEESLPANASVARQLYQNWLLSLLESAKLEGAKVSDISSAMLSGPRSRDKQAPAYQAFTYKLTGSADGSLSQLVRLLHGFYRASHLHRISQMVIRPRDDGKRVDLEMQVQALMLPGIKRTDRLSDAPLNELPLGTVANYEDVIAGRKLFAEYVPPAPPRPRVVQQAPPRRDPPKPVFDVAKYALLTAIVEQDNRPQVWVRILTTGQTLALSEGDEFTVGSTTCKVLEIGMGEAVIGAEGKRMMVSLGESLREAVAVPAEGL